MSSFNNCEMFDITSSNKPAPKGAGIKEDVILQALYFICHLLAAVFNVSKIRKRSIARAKGQITTEFIAFTGIVIFILFGSSIARVLQGFNCYFVETQKA